MSNTKDYYLYWRLKEKDALWTTTIVKHIANKNDYKYGLFNLQAPAFYQFKI